jgi:prepilin-type N-terminal cleavage/methylation domain-containing protein
MKRGKQNRRGYTAVEVLIAITLFAIGAAGVIGMLKVTVQGASDARRFDIATNIANEWVSRLQRDSMLWTLPNAVNPTLGSGTGAGELGATQWLKDIDTAACNVDKFCTPNGGVPVAAAVGGLSSAFDIVGRDVNASEEHFFCVQYRMGWIAPLKPAQAGQCSYVTNLGPTNASCCPGPELCFTALMRVDIRVFWRRQEYGSIPNCAAVNPDANPNQFHFVYATTSIRENQIQ